MFRKKYGVAFCLFSAVVLFLGLTTNSKLAVITSSHDKAAHFIAFGAETMLFVAMFEPQYIDLRELASKLHILGKWVPETVSDRLREAFLDRDASISKYVLAFVVCCLGASTLSEFAQFFLSGGKRSFDVFDMLCNAAGSTVGLLAAYKMEH